MSSTRLGNCSRSRLLPRESSVGTAITSEAVDWESLCRQLVVVRATVDAVPRRSQLLLNDHRGDGEQPEAYSVDEFVHQVRWSRILGEVSDGHIHFSMKHLMRGGAAAEVASKLRETLYAEPALPPATPWAAPDALASPPRIVGARVEGDSVRVRIDPASLDNARRWVAQAYRDGSWHTELGLAGEAELTVATPGGGSVESIVVRGVDRFGRLSLPASRER